MLAACRREGLHTAVDTSGAVARERLIDVAPLTDRFLYDVKLADDERHRTLTGVSNRQILDNLQALGAAHRAIVIRVPVVPDEAGAAVQLDLLGFRSFQAEGDTPIGRDSRILGIAHVAGCGS